MTKVINKTVSAVKKAQESYHKPTPKFWRKVGDSILGAGTVLTVVAGIYKNPVLTIASAVCTWLGKTLTNFASE